MRADSADIDSGLRRDVSSLPIGNNNKDLEHGRIAKARSIARAYGPRRNKKVWINRPPVKLHDAAAHAKLVNPEFQKKFDDALKRSRETGVPAEFDSEGSIDFGHLILSRNPQSNRPINKKTIEFLARKLRNGEDFYMRSHPVVFNSEGFLENGQHRAWASILTGIPSRHRIVVGVEPGSEQNTDPNLKATDRYVREGFDLGRNTNRLATLRLLYYASAGVRCESPDDIIYEFGHSINADSSFGTALAFARDSNRRSLCYPRVLSAAYYMLSKSPTDADGAIQFLCQSLDTTGGKGPRKFRRAATSLRNRLDKLKSLAKTERALRGDSGAIEMICAIVVAWNECPDVPDDYRWQEGGLFPEVR